MRPVLASLSSAVDVSVPEIRSTVAEVLAVTDADQQQLLASGKQTTFANRVAGALTHVAHANLVSRPARGRYAITARGHQVLLDNPTRVDMGVLNNFEECRVFWTTRRAKQPAGSPVGVTDEVSPSEAIGALVAESDGAVAADLLTRILAQPPVFLEILALRLLRAMGYGDQESLMEHTGHLEMRASTG